MRVSSPVIAVFVLALAFLFASCSREEDGSTTYEESSREYLQDGMAAEAAGDMEEARRLFMMAAADMQEARRLLAEEAKEKSNSEQESDPDPESDPDSELESKIHERIAAVGDKIKDLEETSESAQDNQIGDAEAQPEEPKQTADPHKANSKTLKGSIFVVTKTQQPVDIGPVDIALYPAEALVPAERRAAQNWQEELQRIKESMQVASGVLFILSAHNDELIASGGTAASTAGDIELVNSKIKEQELLKARLAERKNNFTSEYPRHVFTLLQQGSQPTATTTSAADGSFSVQVPQDGRTYFLAASAKQPGFSESGEFIWMTRIPEGLSADEDYQTFSLNNGNIVSAPGGTRLLKLLPGLSVQ